MEHVEWAGFHFEDLIFPLFMFISGVAIPFALISKLEKKVPKAELAKKAVKRGAHTCFTRNGVQRRVQ